MGGNGDSDKKKSDIAEILKRSNKAERDSMSEFAGFLVSSLPQPEPESESSVEGSKLELMALHQQLYGETGVAVEPQRAARRVWIPVLVGSAAAVLVALAFFIGFWIAGPTPGVAVCELSVQEGVVTPEDDLLHPRFYLVEDLEDGLEDRIRKWLADRPNWIM